MSRIEDIKNAFSEAVDVYFDEMPNKNLVLSPENYDDKHKRSVLSSLKYIFSNKRVNDDKYQNAMMQFREKLATEAPYINLDIFDKNLKTLNIYYNNYALYNRVSNKKVKGSYDSINNNLYIDKDESLRIFYHELLHVASANIDNENEIYKIGFRYANIDEVIHIGKYFNEGYTEVLADRYFGLRTSPAYAKEKVFASMIEDVVGQETMESFYFNADLLSLFEELEKYSSEDKIVRFFKNIELMHMFNNKREPANYAQLARMFGECQTFCLECYLEKLKQDGLSYEDITRKYWKHLDSIYEKTMPAYCDIIHLSELVDSTKKAYNNVMGTEKSNYKL